MQEAALIAFTTFFATIGPIDVAALFAVLTAGADRQGRRKMAFKGVAIAFIVLMAFVVFGGAILERLGITLAAMRVAGGLLLFLIAVDMVFARHSGGVTATEDETHEARGKKDISVFPLATPLIAGPGTMGAVVLLSAGTEGDLNRLAVVAAALAAVLALTLALLLVAGHVQRLLGVTGLNVMTRVVGVLLAALAVQFVFDGIEASSLIRG